MTFDLIVFDLDGTLARSKQPVAREMANLFTQLLTKTKIAVISGGAFPQFEKQVVAQLPKDAALENLFILPTSGSALYEFKKGNWEKVYEEHIPQNEVIRVEEVVRAVCEKTGLIDFSTEAFGPRIEYRGSQITLSALGQLAPLEAKEAWDPDKSKRRTLAEAIAERLPEFTVTMGGMTSIDITKKGIDKAYGVYQLANRLHIPESSMLYVGDQLVAGGNDEAVYTTEARVRAVQDPEETLLVIRALLDGQDVSSHRNMPPEAR